MIVFSTEGPPRTIDARDVIAVYKAGGDKHYTFTTIVLAGGEEVCGAVPNEALARLERELADSLPPAA
jgi:hypothetical protein